MTFFNICPRDKKYLTMSVPYIPLKVIRSDGVDITPDFNVDVTELNKGFKHFKVNTGKGDKFSVSVILKRNEKAILKKDTEIIFADNVDSKSENIDWDVLTKDLTQEEVNVATLLNYWMRTGTPLLIQSRIMGVGSNANQLWLITENRTRKQQYDDYTVWDLTFTKYVAHSYPVFTGKSAAINKALANKSKKTTSKKTTTAKAKTTARDNLKKCKLSNLVYSKNKKVVPCVKYMQVVLYGFGFLTKAQVDGWYGKVTVNAVKKFQKKFHLKWKVAVTGRVDKATFIALNYAEKNSTTSNTSSTVRTPSVKNGKLVM